jgi:hypothetical protein
LSRGIHKLHLILIKWIIDMKLRAMSVGNSKGKERGKIIIANIVSFPLGHPMHSAYTSCLLY